MSKAEYELLRLTLIAHAKSAYRQNISTSVMANVATGSGSLTNAIAAAILSIGELHAPLAQTISALTDDVSDDQWRRMLDEGLAIPGWGNSFCKYDEIWTEVEAFQREHWPVWWKRADRMSHILHDYGRDVYPNPSLYTAITVIVLDMPCAAAPLIFIEGRMWSWAAIALGYSREEVTRI